MAVLSVLTLYRLTSWTSLTRRREGHPVYSNKKERHGRLFDPCGLRWRRLWRFAALVAGCLAQPDLSDHPTKHTGCQSDRRPSDGCGERLLCAQHRAAARMAAADHHRLHGWLDD